MKRVTFHEDADAELIEAARYYEARTPSLGLALLLDVEDAVEQIQATQRRSRWSVRKCDTSCCGGSRTASCTLLNPTVYVSWLSLISDGDLVTGFTV